MRGFVGLIGVVSCLLIAVPTIIARSSDGHEIRIDVPVVLTEAKVVFNLDHLAFEGDEPTGLLYLRDMLAYFKTHGAKARIVAVFHGPAGYMLLNDSAYDRVRNWQGGNPYKAQIATLIQEGVEVEECGDTMASNRWYNAELLPNVKVNTGANFRIVQLVQEGFVQLQP
jgi:intracellular sulfur oxidation DsrE/DsrF family protein